MIIVGNLVVARCDLIMTIISQHKLHPECSFKLEQKFQSENMIVEYIWRAANQMELWHDTFQSRSIHYGGNDDDDYTMMMTVVE